MFIWIIGNIGKKESTLIASVLIMIVIALVDLSTIGSLILNLHSYWNIWFVFVSIFITWGGIKLINRMDEELLSEQNTKIYSGAADYYKAQSYAESCRRKPFHVWKEGDIKELDGFSIGDTVKVTGVQYYLPEGMKITFLFEKSMYNKPAAVLDDWLTFPLDMLKKL